MADDVMPHSRAVRMGYDGPDSYEVLRYLAQRVSDPIFYFMKRYAPFGPPTPASASTWR